MKKYTSYITESLDSPVEFYMTDDTELPVRVYGAFELDGTNYGMSLEASTYDKVYILKMYRIVNKKARMWSFVKPNHVRVGFSTLLKFVESCVPFIKTKMDGVIVPVKKELPIDKFDKFLSLLIKRTYQTKFKNVPVTVKDSDKEDTYFYNHLFFVRREVSTASLFKTKAFRKYEFSDQEKTPESLGDDITPRKQEKRTFSLQKSKKYAFGKLAVEMGINDEFVSRIENDEFGIRLLTPSEIPENDYEKIVLPDFEFGPFSYLGQTMQQYVLRKVEGSYKWNYETDKNVPLPIIFTMIAPETCKKIMSGNFESFGVLIDELKKEVDKNYKASIISKSMLTKLKGSLIYDYYTESFYIPDNELQEILKAVMYVSADEFESSQALAYKINKFDNSYNTSDYTQDYILKQRVVMAKIVDTDVELSVDDPTYAKINKSTPYGALGFESDHTKIDITQKTLSYLFEMDAMKKWDEEQQKPGGASANWDDKDRYTQELYNYTGSGFETINSVLRDTLKYTSHGAIIEYKRKLQFDKEWNNPETKPKHNDYPNPFVMIDAFNEKKVILDKPIWVFRNCNIPGAYDFQAGQDIIDPGFLSTSIDPLMSLGSANGNTRLKIYLPVGTECYPVTKYSAISDENEIILPAFSRLKIVESYAINTDFNNRNRFVCVYTGHAMNSFYDMVKEEAEKEMKNEPYKASLFEAIQKSGKNVTVKSPGNGEEAEPSTENKWGAEMASKEVMEKIKKKFFSK